MEARFEGGQGPEGAVAPYMEWNGMFIQIVGIFLPDNIVKPQKMAFFRAGSLITF